MNKPYAIGLWLGVGIILAGLQFIAQASYSRQDNPDQANQRPGFVTTHPEKAPIIDGVSYTLRPTLIIFDRNPIPTKIIQNQAKQTLISDRATIILVTKSDIQQENLSGVKKILNDRDQAIARKFNFDTPTDGGYPVGYAVVDSKGFLRYRTLDPSYSQHRDGIETILKDVK